MRGMTGWRGAAAVLLVLVLAVSSLSVVHLVRAQCSVRSDWGLYRVVRGDTLYRIARRFNSTTTALAQGNCLLNANRIYVGQQLRVPTGGPGGTPPGGSSRQFTTGATFQQYENGFMVWRGDNGEIRVYVGPLAGDADSIGELTVYAARQYSGLPSQTFNPPAGRVAPIMGFGKVWGNIPTVRQRLGWAITPEQSHTMTIQVSNGNVVGFTIPGTRWVNYQQGARWTVSGFIRPTLPPPPPPPPTPYPTISPSDCFAPPYRPGGGISAGVTAEVVSSVTVLDNVPPRGMTLATLQPGAQGVVTEGPICFTLGIQHGRYWKVRFADSGVEGWTAEYGVAGDGTETTYLRVLNARIVSFTVQPNPVMAGAMLTVSWQVEGAQYALLTVLDAATNQPLAPVQELPAAGSTTVQAPGAGTSELRLILHAANLTTRYPVNMYARLAESALSVPVVVFSDQTSLTTQAAFQAYENGFMVWRADTGTIYIFGLGLGTYPQSSYEGLPDNACGDVPPGLVCPINGFGRIWANDVNTRRYLGWATSAEQGYQATIVTQAGTPSSITLPDGRTAYMENGTTWHF